MMLFRLINYSGIAAAVFIGAAFVTGLLEADIRLHKTSAGIGAVFFLLHAGLALYKNIKFVWFRQGGNK